MCRIQVSRLNYRRHAAEEHPDPLRRRRAAVSLGHRRADHHAVRAREAGRRFVARSPRSASSPRTSRSASRSSALALLRLVWRLFNPVPPAPASTPRWQQRAAHVSHFLLYALLLITPVLGWLMSSARNFHRQLVRPVHAARLDRAEPARVRAPARVARVHGHDAARARASFTSQPRSSIISSIATTCCAGCCRCPTARRAPDPLPGTTTSLLTMRKHQQFVQLLVLVLVCGSVALAATQWTMQPQRKQTDFRRDSGRRRVRRHVREIHGGHQVRSAGSRRQPLRREDRHRPRSTRATASATTRSRARTCSP